MGRLKQQPSCTAGEKERFNSYSQTLPPVDQAMYKDGKAQTATSNVKTENDIQVSAWICSQ